MIILHVWPILIRCPTEAKLWLISKTMSKGKANNSMQCGLASKQFQKSTLQKKPHKTNKHSRTTWIDIYYGTIDPWYMIYTMVSSRQNKPNFMEFITTYIILSLRWDIGAYFNMKPLQFLLILSIKKYPIFGHIYSLILGECRPWDYSWTIVTYWSN